MLAFLKFGLLRISFLHLLLNLYLSLAFPLQSKIFKMSTNAINLTAKELVEDGLPDLLRGLSSTDHQAWHNIHYIGRLGSWTSFEKAVREAKANMQFNGDILGYTMPNPQQHSYHLSKDQLLCGDEASVHARFQQNVGHVMTAVYDSLGIKVRFGDAAASTDAELGGIPDIVCVDESGKTLMLGEVKTSWKHDLAEMWPDHVLLRKALGQIADYMFHVKLRFVFLTTYNSSIFLKQEPDPVKPGNYVLWYSNIIKHRTRSSDVEAGETRPQEYWGKVSLRECFLYLAAQIQSEGYKADNGMERNKWVGGAGDIGDDGDHLDESSSGSECEESQQPEPSHEDASEHMSNDSSSELSDPPLSPEGEAPRWTFRPRTQISYGPPPSKRRKM